MNLKISSFYWLCAVLFFSCNATKNKNLSYNSTDKKVDSLLQIMTLEEKIGQLNQYNGFYNATGPVPKEGAAAKKI